MENKRQRNIAYRCPVCGVATLGVVGDFARRDNIVRLKCECEEAPTLDISLENEEKVKISVPCLFCKESHVFVLPRATYLNKDEINLSCPFSGVDILHIGLCDVVATNLKRTEDELSRLLTAFGATDLSDIQPSEMNDDEILPDPAVYDTIRLVVKDIENEGGIECMCKDNEGKYDLRFAEGGIQCYCERCGAAYLFRAMTETMAEEYLSLTKIKLS